MGYPQEIWFTLRSEAALSAFRAAFTDLPRVRFFDCAYQKLPDHDCFATAGNAFGIMSAGVDAAVIGHLGQQVMKSVQDTILDRYLGEQPIGTAFVIATGDAGRPFLCHAPTMRVPGSIEGTDNVYCATWAALLAVFHHNGASDTPIETLAFPAFGCGYGGLDCSETARQMAVAYRHFLDPPHRLDWDHAAAVQKAVTYRDGKNVVR